MVKIRLLPTALLFVLCTLSVVHAGDNTPLNKEMGVMNRAFRLLKKKVGDANQNTALLELVAKIKKAAVESVDLIPEKAAALPESDRAAFTARYKTGMEELVAAIDKLETALKAEDNEAAAKIVVKISAMRETVR